MPLEQPALNAGLINSEQIMAYCDSYTTGLARNTLIDALDENWGIGSPQQAAAALLSLSDYGDRFFYDIVLRVYSEGSVETAHHEVLAALIASGRYGIPETLRQQPGEEILSALGKAMKMLEHLRSCFRVLKDDVNGQYLPKDYSAGVLAWDLGRLVTVARMSLDCQYIDQAEFSRLLAYVDSKLRSNFSSWPQFAKSYIIGRACWVGQNMMLGGIIGIAEGLMADKNSPWVLSPL